ncbi:hypothetical protein FHR81_004530 [Actinoalloteichus hoggarensis]|nr:hypothetical protein [Actinoalloteichus hoggarensis]MBB5923459.1 hypothetical protein [Actinoalloteichus hoggarensis]
MSGCDVSTLVVLVYGDEPPPALTLVTHATPPVPDLGAVCMTGVPPPRRHHTLREIGSAPPLVGSSGGIVAIAA